tara:strand:- start:646 stop:1401 length:756 start_codon:yes stop_codon:yes gene_type:complete
LILEIFYYLKEKNMKKKLVELSVILPCYNECKNIPIIVERFSELINKNQSIEVIMVNNGSNDDSKKILNKLAKYNHFLKVINLKKNLGYGGGIHRGLIEASGNILSYTHSDLQTNPNDILRGYEILKKQKNENVFLKGLRLKRPLFDQFFTVGMSIFESLYLGKFLWDINAQPNIFPKSLLSEIKEFPKDFSFDLFLFYIARVRGYKVIRFNVDFPKRIHGQSSWNKGIKSKIKFIKRTIRFTIDLNKLIK